MVRGEIWWANLPVPSGSEPGFRRPVLIIQADSFNRSKIKTVICSIITPNLNLAKVPGNVLLEKEDTNLPKPAVVNIPQIVTLDKSFLTECIGTLNKRILNKVESGLKLVLEI